MRAERRRAFAGGREREYVCVDSEWGRLEMERKGGLDGGGEMCCTRAVIACVRSESFYR